jgi:hypothetical protein
MLQKVAERAIGRSLGGKRDSRKDREHATSNTITLADSMNGFLLSKIMRFLMAIGGSGHGTIKAEEFWRRDRCLCKNC